MKRESRAPLLAIVLPLFLPAPTYFIFIPSLPSSILPLTSPSRRRKIASLCAQAQYLGASFVYPAIVRLSLHSVSTLLQHCPSLRLDLDSTNYLPNPSINLNFSTHITSRILNTIGSLCATLPSTA